MGVVLVVGMYCILYLNVLQKFPTSWLVLGRQKLQKQLSLDEVIGVRQHSWDCYVLPQRGTLQVFLFLCLFLITSP